MQYLTLALSLAAVAYAQLPAVPSCSLNCFVTALTGDGCSGLTDFKCHCAKPGLSSQVVPCVKQNCPNMSDQVSVLQIVSSQCDSAGVPITVSHDASDSSRAAAATGGASGGGSAAATASAGSSGGSGGASGSGSGGASATGSSSGGESTAVSSSSPAQFTGAADHNVANGAALGIGLAAIMAAL